MSSRITYVASLLLVFLISGCLVNSTDENNDNGIRGSFVNEDGRSAVGAIVTLIPIDLDTSLKKRGGPELDFDFNTDLPKATTDENGEYWFDNLVPGEYNIAGLGVIIDDNGDTTGTVGALRTKIMAEDSTLNNIGVDTLRALGAVEVTVKPSGNELIDSVSCTITDIALTVLSDSNGVCVFPKLPKGEYTVEFEHLVYKIDPAGNVTVSSGDTTKSESTVDSSSVPKDSVVKIDSVEINVGVEGSGGSVAPSSANFEKGDSVEVEATADNGYIFKMWTVNGSSVLSDSSSSKTMVTATEDDSITAHFEKLIQLIISKTGDGTVMKNGDTLTDSDTSLVQKDSSITITAEPDSGWILAMWNGTDKDSAYDSSSLEVKATMDTSISVVFEKTKAPVPDSVIAKVVKIILGTVTITSGNDTLLNGDEGEIKTDSNTILDISAVPDKNALFEHWNILAGKATIGDSSKLITTLQILSDSAEISASFVKYGLISVMASAGGTVTGPDSNIIPDSAFDIEAIPMDHFRFLGWTLDSGKAVIGDSSMMKTTVTVAAGDTAHVQAQFEKITHQLTVVIKDDAGNLVSPSSTPIMVDRNAPVDIEVTNKQNFRFEKWVLSGDSGIIDIENSAKTKVTLFSDVTVTAHFQARHILSVTSDGNGKVSPSSAAGYVGDDMQVTATADTFHTFKDWSIVSGTVTIANKNTSSTTASIGSDATIRANFTRNQSTLTLNAENVPQDTAGLQPSSPTVVNDGDTTTIRAVRDTSRYTFSHWKIESGAGIITDSTQDSTGIIIEGPVTVTAVYTLRIYLLNMLTAPGGQGAPTGETQVNPGQNVIQLSSRSNSIDTVFNHWSIVSGSGSLDDSTNPNANLTVNSDLSIRPVFTRVLDTLILINPIKGFAPTPDTSIVPRGTPITIKANPTLPQNPIFWTTIAGRVTFVEGTTPQDETAKVIVELPIGRPPIGGILATMRPDGAN